MDVPVAVVGGGQAGLSISHHLTELDIDHVVLERGRIGQSWRDRWDSFCLVTPNWTVQLPSHPYDRDDPDGFMPKDEIVSYLERYASAVAAPIKEGVDVQGIERDDSGFSLTISDGPLMAKAVVLATGAYQKPHRPPAAASLPADLFQIDVEGYKWPDSFPPGRVLIVGSGQSGCQIAEELNAAGREVVLSCGRAPWAPRRVGDRDVVWWAFTSGFFDQTLADLPSPMARLVSNVVSTGHDGGHDLHVRTLIRDGVTVAGHFLGAEGGRVRFAPDLAESMAWSDARHAELIDEVRKFAAEQGIEEPYIEPAPPWDYVGPENLDVASFGSVLFTTGFRPDYRSWLPWPDAFDDLGFPIHEGGASISVPGLFFIGVHFLMKRKSSLLFGVGEDAAIVAGRVASYLS